MAVGKKKRIGRPNLFIYYAACVLAAPFYKTKYNISVDRSGIKDIKGPALVLAPHISGMDHIIMALTLFPHRPTFVMSEHFLNSPLLRKILPSLHIITKKMFCADTGAVLNILRAIKEENIVVLFPEGRLTWYGHSLDVTEGTYELVKKLGVDVYTVVGNGAYLSYPKWGLFKRRGKIKVTTEKILCGNDIKNMSDEEIRFAVDNAVYHDEEQAMAGIRYRCKDTTAGLNGILWSCPSCHGVHTLLTEKGRIVCTACGMDATLDECYKIHGAPVSTVNEWFKLCVSSIDTSVPLSCKCKLEAVHPKTHNMLKDAGEGVITLDSEGLHYRGTLLGEAFEFDLPPTLVKALPITVGKHFDVYYRGRLIYVYPEDGRDTVRFAAYLDKLVSENLQDRLL